MDENSSSNGSVGEASPADLLRNEVAAEDAEFISVPFRDGKLRVKHADDWPSSANEDMQAGRFVSWAEKALYSDADVETWIEADPTNREVQAFFVAYGEATGQGPKLNREARRLQARTR